MKKSLALGVAFAVSIGIAGVASAAANPFVDVPAKHWAYDAVSKLTSDGVIDGYGDGTFRGDKPMTRYEMAQVTAKALAYEQKNLDSVSAADKKLIDKLQVEFYAELQNLGVRVSNVESKVDALNKLPKFGGEALAEYNYYKGANTSQDNSPQFQGRLRLWVDGNVNDAISYHARMAAVTNYNQAYLNQPSSVNQPTAYNSYVKLDYGFMQAKTGNWQFILGDFTDQMPIVAGTSVNGNHTASGIGFNGMFNQPGIVDDSNITGILADFGTADGKLKVDAWYGSSSVQPGDRKVSSVYADAPTYAINSANSFNMFGVDAGYKFNDNAVFYAAYYNSRLSNAYVAISPYGSGSTGLPVYSQGNATVNIWELGLGYKFNDCFKAAANYARRANQTDYEANTLNYGASSWVVRFDWKAADVSTPGTFDAYASYGRIGRSAQINSTYNDGNTGDNIIGNTNNAWFGSVADYNILRVGADYVPWKNVRWNVEFDRWTYKSNNVLTASGYTSDVNTGTVQTGLYFSF